MCYMYTSAHRNLALWYQASYICHSLHMPFEVLVIAHKIHFLDYCSYLSFRNSSNSSEQLTYIYLLAKLNSITFDIFFFVSIIKLSEQSLWSTILYGIICLLILFQLYLIFLTLKILFLFLCIVWIFCKQFCDGCENAWLWSIRHSAGGSQLIDILWICLHSCGDHAFYPDKLLQD